MFLALLPAVCTAQTAPTEKPPLNLLLVSIDTLRADHVGAYGYFRATTPAIDALAKDGILFERCISPLARTTPSHASLLTGLYPIEHGLIDNITHERNLLVLSDDVETYAEAARSAGYHTAAFVSAAPVKRETGLSAGFEVWDEPDASQRPADETNASFLPWLAKAKDAPFFAWVHYFDPHTPYRPPAPFDGMFKSDDALRAYMKERKFADKAEKQHAEGDVKGAKAWNSEEAINRYDGEVRYVDEQFARVVAALKETGVWDRTVVVVMSDHGEGLGQHDWPNHGGYWREQLHVPLVMRIPGVSARREPAPISTVDILPKLLATCDRLPKAKFSAQASSLPPDAAGVIYSQTPGNSGSTIRTLTSERWRLVRRPGKGELLFDLAADPFELTDVASLHKEEAERMRKQLDAIVAAQSENARRFKPARAEPARRQRVDQLKELGYIETEGEEDEEKP
ncbi:MAG: sulfatase [Phycisphaerales bacterium]|nr:sulfatase [Phycisphaerales bacterium]